MGDDIGVLSCVSCGENRTCPRRPGVVRITHQRIELILRQFATLHLPADGDLGAAHAHRQLRVDVCNADRSTHFIVRTRAMMRQATHAKCAVVRYVVVVMKDGTLASP
jgi:hypothetical protein